MHSRDSAKKEEEGGGACDGVATIATTPPRAHAGAKCTTRPVLHAGAAGQGWGGEGEGKWRIKVRGAWHSTFAHRRLGLHTASENGKSNLHVHREAVHCVVKRIL